MKYYVVSETELKQLLRTHNQLSKHNGDYDDPNEYDEKEQEFEEAEATCQARPVPEWATDFARRVPLDDWEQYSDPQHVFQLKEIER